MKRNLLLTLLAVFFAASTAGAQTLFRDAQFGVRTQNGVYGRNFSVLPALRGLPPAVDSLRYTAYLPVNSGLRQHPVVILQHTGSYLPAIIGGSYTGSNTDSVIVNTARRLAARGYIAIAATYRAGWQPTAVDQETRTQSLLQAAYRGQQDFKTCVRFLKNQAANGNSLMVDTNRIAGWGYGTGGYNVVNANVLDRIEEAQIEKFIGAQGNLFVVASVHGDVEAKVPATLNVSNYPNNSSDFHFAVNAGGAMGDSTWMEGKPNEAPMIGIQAQFDPFAPFYSGGVIVPTTGNFVVNVAGGLLIVDRANRLGLNDELLEVNSQLRRDNDPITLYADQFGTTRFVTRENASSLLSVPNFLPRVRTASLGLDFVDSARLRLVVAATNAVTGDTVTSRRLILNDLRTNPNTLSRTRALAALDTVFAFVLPRMYAGLDLVNVVSVTDLKPADVNLSLYPNPATTRLRVDIAADREIRSVRVLNVQGQTVLMQKFATFGNTIDLDVNGLAAGVHAILITTDSGVVGQVFTKQ